ncbi:MAG: hypothetical protein Q4P14_04590 [Methanobacteriaceae archaeon]|nr:hypothetical protein [Methanobacteriaceae archaeon]
MIEKVIFYDADFLSSFLLINEVSFLKNLFSEIIVPKEVFDELCEHGSPKLVKEGIIELKTLGIVKILNIEIPSNEYLIYKSIKNGNWHKDLKPLGKGESAALALAIDNDGVLASNNLKDVKYYVDKYNLPCLTSSYLIALCVEKNIISINKANSMWIKMIDEKRDVPANTFLDYYSSIYHKDFEDFGHRLFKN